MDRLILLPYCFSFFFFQAEDGIRDVAVTGVQTCALPISEAPARQQARGHVELPPRADRGPLRPEPLGALRGRTRGWKLGDHACGDRARRARRGGARRGEELALRGDRRRG